MSKGGDPPPRWQELDDMENVQWLELLRPFTTTKNLYLSEETALRVAPALQELAGGRATEALRALQNLYLKGSQSFNSGAFTTFIAARTPSGHPVAIYDWE